MKVLIVEDNALAGSMLQEYLFRAGHDVKWATGVKEALTRLQVWAPHCLIVDCVLTDRPCGIDLVHSIQVEGSPYRDTPVILMTAMGDVGFEKLTDSVAGLQVRKVFRKPYNRTELTDALDVIAQEHAHASACR